MNITSQKIWKLFDIGNKENIVYHWILLVIDRINFLIRRVLWKYKNSSVAWKIVCLPHKEGGLGLRDLATWNKALMSKTLWNISAKNDALWIRWIYSEYLNEDDIWTVAHNIRNSPFIKNILSIRDRLVLDCVGAIDKAKALLHGWFAGKGVSEAYDYLRHKGESQFWHTKIWKEFIPPKY